MNVVCASVASYSYVENVTRDTKLGTALQNTSRSPMARLQSTNVRSATTRQTTNHPSRNTSIALTTSIIKIFPSVQNAVRG